MKTFKRFLYEMGGNVFAGKTAPIAKENIESTLKEYFKALGEVFPNKKSLFNSKNFQPLGSVGKKDFSGDIDLAVDLETLVPGKEFSPSFLQSWGLDPEDFSDRVQKLEKRARSATLEQLEAKAFLQMLSETLVHESDKIFSDTKKITTGNMFMLFPQITKSGEQLDVGVQIDWNVGKLDWLKFSYYSDVYKDNVKGLHRTQLMLAMFANKDLIFNHVTGVRDKETGEVVAHSPEEAIEVLNKEYNIKLNDKKVSNFFTLYDIIKALPKDEYEGIMDIYLKILDSTRADIPLDMQKYWKQNQDRLGLKGKFLPNNSRLWPLKRD